MKVKAITWSERVHSGIGAAGPVDRLASPVAEAGQRGFEFPLDRPDPGPLGLEAGEVRSVVFNPCPIPLSRPAPRGRPLERLVVWFS